jgi:hypothetical protein
MYRAIPVMETSSIAPEPSLTPPSLADSEGDHLLYIPWLEKRQRGSRRVWKHQDGL